MSTKGSLEKKKKTVGSILFTLSQINSRWMNHLIKILQIWENFKNNVGGEKTYVSHIIQKAKQISKSDYIWLKHFCIAKTTASKIKSQTKNWGKLYPTHTMKVSFPEIERTHRNQHEKDQQCSKTTSPMRKYQCL